MLFANTLNVQIKCSRICECCLITTPLLQLGGRRERERLNCPKCWVRPCQSPGGGALPLEGDAGMYQGHDPFFQASQRSSLPMCVPQMRPHLPPILIFRKKQIAFSTLFLAKISALKTEDAKPFFFFFLLPRPLIFQRKPAPYTLLLETRAAHTHQKKKS